MCPTSPSPAAGWSFRDVASGAARDDLTGLHDRRRLLSELDEACLRASRSGRPVALVFIDLNGFKQVNDSLGHELGDQLLVQVAGRLTQAVRAGETLARWGGDEFTLLVHDLLAPSVRPSRPAAREAAEAIGSRLTQALDVPFQLDGVEIRVEAGVGVSIHPDDAGSGELLRRHADAAMYHAKTQGSGVVVYSDDVPDPLARLELAARIRRAIDRDEMELHYQPIVSLPAEDVVGVEALVRWRDPDRGLIPPDAFIGVAESTGVIDALGDWVLEEMCCQAAEWAARGLYPNLGYNVSPRQLRRKGFAQQAAAVVARHGIDPGRVVFELTESAWSLEGDRLQPTIEGLREAGLALAIDDFGAGYSSLWRLRELPVQIIKIDRSLLRGVPEEPQATAVVAAIFALARAVGCDVVAEGIETTAQRDLLAAEGCTLAQGFLFARPVPADQAGTLLELGLVKSRRSGAS